MIKHAIQEDYFTAYHRCARAVVALPEGPEVTRRNTRAHFVLPLKERLIRDVGYGLSLEGVSAADLVKSMQTAAM
jgi:hypothetical protein